MAAVPIMVCLPPFCALAVAPVMTPGKSGYVPNSVFLSDGGNGNANGTSNIGNGTGTAAGAKGGNGVSNPPPEVRPAGITGVNNQLPPDLKGASTALDELSRLPDLAGKTSSEIESTLLAKGYTSVLANNGGAVWTKALPDGNTAAVRIDPATIRANPKGFADEVPHAHKEIVPTVEVTNGNYKPGKTVTTLDDSCCATINPAKTHIPIKK